MKKIHWVSAIHITARITGMVSALLSVYFFTRLFSVAEFGYWSWLLSVSVMITSQDFGILSAMRIWLGKEYATQNDANQKSIFAAGLVGILVVFIMVLLGLSLYLAESGAREYNPLLLSWVVSASVFSIFGTVAANALLAFLHAGSVGLIELFRSIMQIVVIMLAYTFRLDLDLTIWIYYSLFVIYVPIVMLLLYITKKWGFLAILTQGLQNIPSTFNALWHLVKNGFLLWVNQLAYVTILSADVFVAGIFLAQNDVATVAVVNRLVNLGLGIVGAGLLPYFGLYVHKLANQDSSWVRLELRKAIVLIGLLGAVYTAILLLAGQRAVFAWTGLNINAAWLYFMAGLEFGILSLLTYLQLYFQGPRLSFKILPIVFFACAIRLAALWILIDDYGIPIIFISSVLANGALALMLYRKLILSIKNNEKMVLMW